MTRTLVRIVFFLTALALRPTDLPAEDPPIPVRPVKPAAPAPGPEANYPIQLTKSGSDTSVTGTLNLAAASSAPCPGANTSMGSTTFNGIIANGATLQVQGENTYTGSTTISNGVFVGAAGAWTAADQGVGTFLFANGCAGAGAVAPKSPAAPIPRGPVFYIITEGAGLGDSVRSVPCTGQETVLSTVAAVGGLSQVSSTKMWIARPSSDNRNTSTILTVDWDALSRRGINTTNYTLKPGDRLVFGEDPLVTQTNLLGKKTAPIERIYGLVSLIASTVAGLQETPAAIPVINELVRKDLISDNENVKRILLDALHRVEAGKKAAPQGAAGEKTGKQEESPKAVSPAATEARLTRAEEKSMQTAPNTPAKPDRAEKSLGAVKEAAAHELAMQPLPAYRIEPPDVIQLEMLKVVPLSPYRAGIYDVFQIRANALPDHPIENKFMIAADGAVDLGQPYGSVKVAGKTKDEIRAALDKALAKFLRAPEVSVQLTRAAGVQPVSGQYLVAPDGTINLRQYGQVALSGKTVAEARAAVQNHLKQFLDSPEVSVDVVAYNSKTYYVITQGAGIGDSIRRLPITGNETVLDAMSNIGGLSQVSSKNIWIARPSEGRKTTILRVDWDAITGRGATATNYQIFPHDRVYIAQDPLITNTNLLGKNTAPIERIMGILSLTTSVVRGIGETPSADVLLKEFVQKGLITDDEGMKKIVSDIIRLRSEESKKAAPPRTDRSH